MHFLGRVSMRLVKRSDLSFHVKGLMQINLVWMSKLVYVRLGSFDRISAKDTGLKVAARFLF